MKILEGVLICILLAMFFGLLFGIGTAFAIKIAGFLLSI